jgi:hypothetical protein
MLRKTNPRTVWLLFYLWGSYLVTRLFVDFSSLTAYPTMSLNAMVNGTAVRPFVSRALVPIIIRWIDAHTSDFFQYQVMMACTSSGFATEFYVHGYTFEKAILLALTFLFYFGTALLLRSLARRYYGLGESAAWLAGLAGLACIPLLFAAYSPVYDPPTIFFSAAMLMACTLGSSTLFGVCFLPACVNRETTILFLPVYLAFEFIRLRPLLSTDRTRFAKRAALPLFFSALLAGSWFVIRFQINQRYQHNRGGVLDFHLLDHNLRLFSVAPFAAFWSLFIVLVIAIFCIADWRSKPQPLRWSILLIFLPLTIGSLLYGYVEELRVYFELYPMLFLLALPTVTKTLGRAVAANLESLKPLKL